LVEFSKENESCVPINTYKKLQFNRKTFNIIFIFHKVKALVRWIDKGLCSLSRRT